MLKILASYLFGRRYWTPMSTASAVDVTSYILQLAKQDRRQIDQLAVLKILYLAQGVALARLGCRLYWEKIKAWPLGPVVPQVWHKINKYGEGPVADIEGGDDRRLSETDKAIIECTWSEHGQKESSKLVDLTHQPGPWRTVRDLHGLADGEPSTEEVPIEFITQHFKSELPPPLTEEQKQAFPRLA